jgi:hypothetical protein
MLVRALAGATLAAALVPDARPAQAQPAPEDPEQFACRQQFDPALISVTALPMQVAVNTSLDTRALTAIEGKGANERVLGRTAARLRNTSRFQTREQKLPSGRTCIRPAAAVSIAYEPTVVYISSEYPAGSCEYHRILAHEQRHVSLYAAHLVELAPLVQQDLRDFFAAANPVSTVPGQTRLALQAGLQEVVRSRITRMAHAARERQLEVDSSEEVRRLSDLGKSCAGERDVTPAGE